jgi:hypothetical protein
MGWRDKDELVLHIYHHFPDVIPVDVLVTMDQVPTSLGLEPGTPSSNEGETNG